MKVAWMSDTGRVRENNEDCVLVDESLGLLLVADGMGGHSGGEVASHLAARTISRSLRSSLNGSGPASRVADSIHRAVAEADAEIRKRAQEEPTLHGMGTTMVLAVVRHGELHVAHAGDSRAYLIREGKIQQLTEDHSLAVQAEKNNVRISWPGKRAPLKNMLVRSLGNQLSVEAELKSLAWASDDFLVMCSDGLSNQVDAAKIRKLVLRHADDLNRACSELVKLANERGGPDNISVIVARGE
jgi:protein phosphatase